MVIQFKLECQVIARHPEYRMDDRAMLTRIDYSSMEIEIDGKRYPLKDSDFPTIDPVNPARLTSEEQEVMDALITSFMNCEKLQRHTRFLYAEGSIYLRFNGNLPVSYTHLGIKAVAQRGSAVKGISSPFRPENRCMITKFISASLIFADIVAAL